MNAYRLIAIPLTPCGPSLPVAACSAGLGAADPALTSPAPGPADPVSVDAPAFSFPILHGSEVAFNGTCYQAVVVELDDVLPGQAVSFCTWELPRARHAISADSASSDRPGPSGRVDHIQFTVGP